VPQEQAEQTLEPLFFLRFKKAMRRPQTWGYIAIFLAALLIRFLHLLEMQANDPFFALPSVDPKVYHEWALRIMKGDWFGTELFFNAPLYPYFLGLLYTIFGPDFFIAKLIQCLNDALMCVLITFLAEKLFNRKVALVAGLLAVMHEGFIFYSGLLLIYNAQTVLTVLLALFLLHCRKTLCLKSWLMAGCCLGLTALARPNTLLFPPFLFIWLWLLHREGILSWRRALVCGALFCLGIGLMIAPLTIRNLAVTGQFVLINSQGGTNFHTGNNPDAPGTYKVPRFIPRDKVDDPLGERTVYREYAQSQTGRQMNEMESSRYWFQQGIDFIISQPLDWLALEVRKFKLLLNHTDIHLNRSLEFTRQFSSILRLPLVSYGFLVALALLGIALTIHRWRLLMPIYAIMLTYAGALLLFFVSSRYRMPLVAFFVIFAAYAICWLLETLRKRHLTHLGMATFALLFFSWFTYLDVHSSGVYMSYYNLGNKYRAMQKWELAQQQYEQSIKSNNNYISSHNNLAIVYGKKKEWHDKALREWNIVLDMGQKRNDAKYIKRARRNINKLKRIQGK